MRRSVSFVAGAAAPVFALTLVFSVAGCPLLPLAIPDPGGDAGADGSPSECASAGDCEDGNPCTNEVCTDGACVSSLADPGSACADANLCNGLEVCNALGQCVSGTPTVVDDGNACTTDACDATTGLVTHAPITPCGPMRMSTWTATAATSAPLARQRHSAVWTGSKMIVWGGSVTGAPSVTATGGVYDPTTDTWTPTSATNAPPPRHSHRAVWTGSKMIVWGGYGTASYENTGGVYDPASDTWAAMSTAGAPSGRTELAMVWADSALVVWGGFNGAALGDGAVYDPAKDTWSALPSSGAPGERLGHTGVWTGSRAIFWGGNNLFDWQKSGAFLTLGPPSAWAGPTDQASAPGPREGHTALWTGKAMVVWGGWNGGPYLDDGASFDPAADADGAWSSLTTTGAPSPRTEHTAVWTGSAMMIWGGCGGDACVNVLGDGGVWTPGAGGGTWKTVPETATLTPRQRHSAVWTGKEMIVWGGKAKSGVTASGARFVP